MLNVETIDLHYGAAPALHGVSLEASPGWITCLLGRNGVGKTSALKAIAGQHPINRGRIGWEGRDVTELRSFDRARAGIAYVPQGREIFPLLSVEENLKVGFAALPRAQRTVDPAIFDLFPMLGSMLKHRGGDLSGGQQQQLVIARALVTKPRLLLLDEPTEGIQPSIIKDIERVIARLRDGGGMAILLVEQYFAFAKALADDFAVMDRGEIIVAGTRAEMDEAEVRGHLTV